MRIHVLPDVFCGLAEKPRRGWVMRGVDNPESTYAHSLEMAGMVEEFAPYASCSVDTVLAREMCMCHDLSDFASEDVTPHDTCSAERKAQIELFGIKWILGTTLPYYVDSDCSRSSWRDGVVQCALLWQGYENHRWPEAVFVEQLDKLQMVRRVLYYESEQDKCMPEMWAHVAERLHEPCLLREFHALYKRRPADIDRRPPTEIRRLSSEEELASREAAAARVTPEVRAGIIAERERAFKEDYPVLKDVSSRVRGQLMSTIWLNRLVL